MSSIIDEEFIIFTQNTILCQQILSHTLTNQQVTIKVDKQEIVKNLVKSLANTNSQYIIENFTDTCQHYLKLNIVYQNIGIINLDLLISLDFDLYQNQLKTRLVLLQGHKSFKIQSLDQRIMLCKMFSKSSIQTINKFSISILDGSFKLVRPILLSCQKSFSDLINSKNKDQNIKLILKNALKQGIDSFKLILGFIGPFNINDQSVLNKRNQNYNIFSKTIYRYIIRSSIEPAFDVSFGSGKYDTMECLTKQQIFNTTSMIQNIVTDFCQFKTHTLYLKPTIPLESLKRSYVKQYFMSNDQQLNTLKQKAMQPHSRVNLNLEPKYVYNIIQFNQNMPINLKRINMGGFSQISKAQAQFWYLLSSQNKKTPTIIQKECKHENQQPQIHEFKLKKQNKKCLAFKTNNFKATQSGRNRINHQMRILSKFKGASSLFLPEYFKVINKKSPFYNYLIMEYLPYPTLNEYNDMNKLTMSFMTKLHLASLIVQSLRFLKNYQIVHMDLKPSNIIISKRIIVKLIDFGQSYHKEVCDKNFKPAFSMPYGSPQVFDGVGKTQFNQKNDIYSWAVIFYQLLFKRLPFIFSRQQAGKIFKQRAYMNYLYYVPEQQENYGFWEIIPLLRNIMFRALDKNIKNRPCTLWLTIVLKQCLNYLINQELNITAPT